MIWTLLACSSPSPPVEAPALCEAPTDPLVARACHGPDRRAAVVALAASPSGLHLPVLVEHLDVPEVRRAVMASTSPAARGALARWVPRRSPMPETSPWTSARVREAGAGMWMAAQSAGGRWRLIDALPDLDDAAYEDAVLALLSADWTLQPPPEEVVDLAIVRDTDPAAWALLAVAGRAGPLLDALQDPARRSAALTVALGGRVPVIAALDDALREAAGDPLTLRTLGDGRAPDPMALTRLLPTDVPARCEALDAVALRLDPVWVAETLQACPSAVPPTWFADPLVFTMVLEAYPDDVGFRRRLLDVHFPGKPPLADLLAVDDPLLLALGLERMPMVNVPADLEDEVLALTAHPDPRVVRAATDLFCDKWPLDALPVLQAQLRDRDTRHHALELLAFLAHPERVNELARIGNDPEMAWAYERVRVLLGAH